MEDTVRLEELVRGGVKAEEPGADINEILQKGDDDTPSIGRMKITSAGYTLVYDTKTGISSRINNNNLPAVLGKKRGDNSYVFSMKQLVKPTIGTFGCLLHKDSPDRKYYDVIGLAVCPKDDLASPYQVTRHMQKKHNTEWGAIEKEIADKEKKEDRDFQRLILTKAVSSPAKKQKK